MMRQTTLALLLAFGLGAGAQESNTQPEYISFYDGSTTCYVGYIPSSLPPPATLMNCYTFAAKLIPLG